MRENHPACTSGIADHGCTSTWLTSIYPGFSRQRSRICSVGPYANLAGFTFLATVTTGRSYYLIYVPGYSNSQIVNGPFPASRAFSDGFAVDLDITSRFPHHHFVR